MVNNFDLIKPILEWRSDDDFYFIQILQRKKDNKESKVNGSNNNSRLIKAYYVKSLEHLEFIQPEIIEMCLLFNARAGINLNRRSFYKMQLQHLRKITEQLLNKDHRKSHRAYNSVVGAYNHDSDKKWILDIDKDEMYLIDDIEAHVNNIIKPEGVKIITRIPSKTGCHIITKPFNVMDFIHVFPEIEIHKNNPTNLYIP